MRIVCIWLFTLSLLSACSRSCKKTTVQVPDLPYLKIDTTNTFQVGDRFILATSTNSCCMYCWQLDSVLQEKIPESPLLRYVETIEDPADPDCAGCSNFYYRIYECVAPGADTLRYVVMPMGEVGGATGCDELKRVDSSHI